MGDSTVPVISHSGGVDRLLRHHGHRRTAASLSRNVAPGYRRGVPAWAQLGQARGGWRLRHGVGAALDCGRLVVATDEEFAREPSRLDEGLAMAPRKVDKQARRRYPCHNNTGRWLPRLGAVIPRRASRPQRARTRRRARRLQPAASHAKAVKLRVRNARALGAALVACSRAASHCHSGQTRV
jgi:hypothetical protein